MLTAGLVNVEYQNASRSASSVPKKAIHQAGTLVGPHSSGTDLYRVAAHDVEEEVEEDVEEEEEVDEGSLDKDLDFKYFFFRTFLWVLPFEAAETSSFSLSLFKCRWNISEFSRSEATEEVSETGEAEPETCPEDALLLLSLNASF